LLLFVNLYHIFAGVAGASDLLFIPNLYHSIASGNFHWFYWCFPPPRFIFPDFSVFCVLRQIIGSDLLTLFVQSCLYTLFSGLLMAYMTRRLAGISYVRSLLPIFLAMAFFTLPGLFPEGAHKGFVLPSWHGGTTLVVLAAWVVWLNCVETPRRAWLVYLIAISLVAGFCEPLCFLAFVCPAVLGVLFSRYSWVSKFGFALLMILPALLGSWIGDRMVPLSLLQYNHQRLEVNAYTIHSFKAFLADFKDPQALLGWIVLLVGLGAAWWKWRPDKANGYRWVSAIMLIFMPVVGSLLIGRYGDTDNMRYFPLSLFVPFASLIWLAWRKYGKILTAVAAIVTVTTACVCLQFLPTWAELTHSPDIELIDSYRKNLRLASGLACYALSGELRYYSKNQLMMADLDPEGFINMKLCSLAWLGVPYTPPPAQKYNFLLTQDLDRRVLLAIYGLPSSIYTVFLEKQGCQLWLYNKDLAEDIATQPPLLFLLSERLKSSGYLLSAPERARLGGDLDQYKRKTLLRFPTRR